MLYWVRVKSHFPLFSLILNFFKISFFTVLSRYETIKNKQVSSANNLTLNFSVVAKSFIYMRKTRSSKIDPCGTPSSIHSQSEVLSIKSDSLNLITLIFFNNPSRFPLAPFCFNLNNKPSCHTLSLAFDISKLRQN